MGLNETHLFTEKCFERKGRGATAGIRAMAGLRGETVNALFSASFIFAE
jgi:hypothetical protein